MRSNLFSMDFLENHLEDLEDYKSLDTNELKQKFLEVSSYFNEDLKKLSEAQLESNFLQPIFRSLGHIYEVQTSKKSEDIDEGTKRIDYAFFYSEEYKESFHANSSERNAIKYGSCSTICEAKSWSLLDNHNKVLKNDNTDPIWQIKKSYLDNINPKEQKAKVPFGILTDGKSWRIYSYRAEIDKFFELNLEEIIKNKDFDRFKIFWFFFSKEAFRGKSYLTAVEAGSKKLQSQVSEDLRKQVYLSLELIATGLFRAYNSGKRDWDEFKKYSEMRAFLEENSIHEIDINHADTEKVILDIIYTESLVYLFRVLFLLYADHRNLFKHRKVETVFYQLLDKIDSYNQIGNIPEGAENISDKNDDYDINGVFEEIDREFNGGLFSIKLHTILNRFDIDNILYANAIDNLTRTLDKKTERPQRVDFSVLEVRHLGTIYEGLLEYKLKKTTEEITIPLLSDKNKTRKLLKGDLFLVNDKGERKATGSYYTPDYIVECIVKNTVGPLIDAIEKESISIQEKILKILALRILDPAMGSGHFLVEVISYINDRIEALIQTELEEYANKPGRKSKAQTELENLLKDAEFGFYKRIIAKKCIYGVDKNPMAVELAKLSIWIYTLQRNKKLEFFDYNLRCGDSLIGSQEKTFSSQLDSQSKERMLFANNEELYKNVVEDFKEEFKKYFELENVDDRMKYYESTIKPNQQKLKYLANIELAIAFANKNDEIHSIYNAHKNKLLGIIRLDKTNEYLKKLIQGKNLEDWELKLFQAAKKIRKDYNPIHWELDFPNVFIDRGGFDGIVGNPPYVFARENFEQKEKDYYGIQYKSAKYQVNIYLLFIERGFSVLNSDGRLGNITPNAWLMVSSGKNLRELLVTKTKIEKIINLPGQSFEGVNVETVILIGKNSYKKNNEIEILISSEKNFELSHKKLQDDFKKNEGIEFYIFADSIGQKIIKKIQKNSENLDMLCIIKAGLQAYETGKGKPKQSAEDVKKRPYDYNFKFNKETYEYLDGKDVNRYNISWAGTYLRYGDHLAAPRTIDIFNKENIIIREITGKYPRLIISCYNDFLYLFNRSNIAVLQKPETDIQLKYVLTILNSSLMSYYFLLNTAKSVRQLFPKIILEDLRRFPIKNISTIAQKPFIQLADTMLDKNKELHEMQKKFNKLLQSDLKIEKLTEKLIAWNKLSWEDFLAELMKKKIELKLNQKAEWMDFFEKEKAKANAIEEVITKTDSEIDLMVYNLYGLTEEEIKIVEGAV